MPTTPATDAGLFGGGPASSRPWLLATLLGAVVVVLALVLIDRQQSQRQAEFDRLQLRLQRATEDLHLGALHLRLGGDARTPWQRQTGQALIGQAESELLAVAREMGDSGAEQALRHSLQPLRGDWGGERGSDSAELAARLGLHGASTHVASLEQGLHQRRQESADRARVAAALVLGLGAALAAALAVGALRSERRRDQLQEALRDETLRTRITLGALAEGVLVVAEDGRIVDGNAAAARLLGLAAQPLAGQRADPGHLRCLRDDGSELPADEWPVGRVLSDRRPLREQLVGVAVGDGEPRWLSVNAEPLTMADGRRGAVVSFTDVSALRRQAVELAAHRGQLADEVRARTQALEQALHDRDELESFAQLMTDHQPTLLAYWTRDMRLRFANRAYLEWFGLRRGEAIGHDVVQVLGPELPAGQRGPIERIFSGQAVTLEMDLTAADGRIGHFLVHREPDRRRDPVDGHFFAATDVTQLHEAEAFTRMIADSLPGRVAYWDRELRCRFVNRLFAERKGRDAADLLGRPMAEVLGPADFAAVQDKVHAALDGLPQRFERSVTDSDGQQRALHVRFTPQHRRGEVDGFLALGTEITELAEARRRAEALAVELARSEQFLRRVADSIPGLVAYWDAGLRCRFANAAYLDWAGKPAEAVVGQAIDTVLDPLTWALSRPNAEAALRGERRDVERELRRHDGSAWPVLVSYVPHRIDGGLQGFIVVITDVTPLKQAEQQLARANDELARRADLAESATRAKSAFLANMSHEIRTPMNAILGLTHLIARDTRDERQRQRLHKVDQAARHLLDVINHVLDLSKIEAGKLTLEVVDFGRDELAERVSAVVTEAAAAKGLPLDIDLRRLPARLRGDPRQLAQALINLAANAVKFTDQGCVEVRGDVVAEQDGRVRLRFEVTDTGIGIPADRQERLFEAFEQADASTTRRFGGTGLGLALTRRLVGLMDGVIGVQSTPGQGSSFWFEVWLAKSPGADRPNAPDATAMPDPPSLQALRSQATGRRVLLVEDNPINQEVAGELLASAGLDVDVAADGAEAVARAVAGGHDLVLMDMQMPGVDGLTATRLLRQRLGRGLPIIAMTANAFAEDRAACLEAGMDDFIGKPVDPDVLYALLARWLPAAA